jgi:hypothetical protein
MVSEAATQKLGEGVAGGDSGDGEEVWQRAGAWFSKRQRAVDFGRVREQVQVSVGSFPSPPRSSAGACRKDEG